MRIRRLQHLCGFWLSHSSLLLLLLLANAGLYLCKSPFHTAYVKSLHCTHPYHRWWESDPQNIRMWRSEWLKTKSWNVISDLCHRAKGNLITMAVLNIVTDFALIIYPLPTLWKLSLTLPRYVNWSILVEASLTHCRKIQLCILFSAGILVVLITLIRLPMIVRDDEAQLSRSFVLLSDPPVPQGANNSH